MSTETDLQTSFETRGDGIHTCGRFRLAGEIHPWTTFCEGIPDIEKGYDYYSRLYRKNYTHLLPADTGAAILVASAGVGYFVKFLTDLGYTNVTAVDSDLKKVEYAQKKGLAVQRENVFDYLEETDKQFDCIIGEQEVNHLRKREFIIFLSRARAALKEGGRLIFNCTNYANPLTAIDHWAHNFNHYCGYTDNSVEQVLEYCGFGNVSCHGIDNYVFYTNPLNWVAKAFTGCLSFTFKILYKMYGKAGHTFTKRMIGIGYATGTPRETGI